jgi:hypothetical protein
MFQMVRSIDAPILAILVAGCAAPLPGLKLHAETTATLKS